MLRIEPTANVNFKTTEPKSATSPTEIKKNKENKLMLTGTLVGLATIGVAAIGLKITAPKNYEEVLKKAGIKIKDGIAILAETGEKYTGKVQRFETRNRKETVKYVNGIMTEKLYHNLTGKELQGDFYKEGKRVLQIWRSAGQVKNSSGFTYRCEGVPINKPETFVKTKDGFAWARNFLKQNNC